jgi:heparan-sulfate lyase
VKRIAIPTLFLICSIALAAQVPPGSLPYEPITPLPPSRVLRSLDLNRPGLEKVKAAVQRNDRTEALRELIAYYRARHSVVFDTNMPPNVKADVIKQADGVLKHVFYVGLGYAPQQYGAHIDWDADPVKDIEWRANMQRFYWQESLLEAYVATKDEKYAKGWMNLTRDWIEKHPVRPMTFDWLDIQIGLRAVNLCKAFEIMRESPSMNPDFVALFLASIYDHAQKSALYPRQTPHNKVVLENIGLFEIAVMFPEFQLSNDWLSKSFEVFSRTLRQQVNPEGVQKEWTPSYHTVVASEMVRVLQLCRQNRIQPPVDLMRTTEKMFDYWVDMTAPDRSLPMFGDTTRRPGHGPDFSEMTIASAVFHKSIFDALAENRLSGLSSIGSCDFPEAGMYFLRSGWGADAIYMALHNSPPALSVHDQPDNGTFELYSHGRWLMPDSGSFAYPETPLAGQRPWFRQTAVHQTLTLDNRNSQNAPKFLLYKPAQQGIVVSFENASYPRLVHRRTVFFIDKRLFVLVDEAIGNATGTLDLHFQFAPGPFADDATQHTAHTAFPEGANVLVWEPARASVTLLREKGQTSAMFYEKVDRPAMSFRSREQAPVTYLTVIVPYLGTNQPQVDAHFPADFRAGQPRLEVQVKTGSEQWQLGRDLSTGQAWVRRAEH